MYHLSNNCSPPRRRSRFIAVVVRCFCRCSLLLFVVVVVGTLFSSFIVVVDRCCCCRRSLLSSFVVVVVCCYRSLLLLSFIGSPADCCVPSIALLHSLGESVVTVLLWWMDLYTLAISSASMPLIPRSCSRIIQFSPPADTCACGTPPAAKRAARSGRPSCAPTRWPP